MTAAHGPDEPFTPATIAHCIRDRTTALAIAQELIRLTGSDGSALEGCLQLARRQIEALTQLADALQDSARGAGGGEHPDRVPRRPR